MGAQEGRPLEAFQKTQFQAAVDASEGKTWLREWVAGPRKWWETQRRHIAKALALLGLKPGMDQTKSLEMAQILGVDYLPIVEQKRKIADQPGYRCRGHGVVSMLEALVKSVSPVERLLLAGHKAGLWGVPLWWDSDSGIIRRIPFRIASLE